MNERKLIERLLLGLLVLNGAANLWIWQQPLPPAWSPAEEQELVRGRAILEAKKVSSRMTSVKNLDAILTRRIVIAAQAQGKDPKALLPPPEMLEAAMQPQANKDVEALISHYDKALQSLGEELGLP